MILSSAGEALIGALLKLISKVAYDHCKEHLLSGTLMDVFNENVKSYEIPEELKQLSLYQVTNLLININIIFTIY